MNGGVRAVDLDSEPMLAPPGPPAQLADPPLLLGRDPGRERCGRLDRSGQTRQRRPLLGRGLAPAAHPLPERLAIHNNPTKNQLPTTRGEPSSMVRHSGAS